MRKIMFGLLAASVALPAAAAAQPGYYDPYYSRDARYTHPYDLNRDGVVTRREQAIGEQQARRYNDDRYGQYDRYGSGYGRYDPRADSRYGYDGYDNRAYDSRYSGNYGQYYDRQGYYSGPTWRGDDGRYYCRRSDGTTGLIVGGAVGALIGREVAGRGDRTLGAVLGGALGAVIGKSVEKNRVRCN